MKMRLEFNKNALSSVESRLFVDKISEEVNRARAFVTRGEGAPHMGWDARRLA